MNGYDFSLSDFSHIDIIDENFGDELSCIRFGGIRKK